MQQTQETVNNSIIIDNSLDSNHEEETIWNYFPKKTMLILKIVQSICGFLLLSLAILTFLAPTLNLEKYTEALCGIPSWQNEFTGIIFAVSGLVAVIGPIAIDYKRSKTM